MQTTLYRQRIHVVLKALSMSFAVPAFFIVVCLFLFLYVDIRKVCSRSMLPFLLTFPFCLTHDLSNSPTTVRLRFLIFKDDTDDFEGTYLSFLFYLTFCGSEESLYTSV